MIKNYLTIAWRNLTRNKIYTFINIAGLSIGLAAAMLIILYVKDEVSYDKFHKGVSHIYRITTQSLKKNGTKGTKDTNTGLLQGPRFSAHVPEILSFVRVQSGAEDIKKGTDIISEDLLYADSSFFSVFSFPLIEGDPKTCLKEPHSVVLSVDEAKEYFGNQHSLGKIIMVKNDGKFVPYKVTGIAKPCPQNSSIKFDMLMPIKESEEDARNSENWFNFYLNTFVVLPDGANPKQVEKKMNAFYNADVAEAVNSLRTKYGDDVWDWKSDYQLQPFTEMHLSVELPAQNGLSNSSNPVYSYILSGIAIFILLIASINFVNLTIARSVRRAKEIGIRKVVGGERKQLILQFLGESFLICLLAFSLALLIVQLALPVFSDLSNKALSMSYLLDAKLIAGYLFLFLLTGLLSGFYPALVLSGYSPVQTLYSRFNLGGKNYLQKSLVVLQFSLASFLIIATFAIYAQFNYLTTEKLGYDDSNLVSIYKQELTRQEAALFKNELLKSQDIADVTFRNGGGWSTVAKVANDSSIQFDYETVDESYLPLMKIQILQGRNFSKQFPSDSAQCVIVNESFVKKAGWKNPIGQIVNFWFDNQRKYTVIGLVKDYHYNGLHQAIGPQLFTMKAGNLFGRAFIKIKPTTATSALKYIESVYKKLFPATPYNYAFARDQNLREYEAEAKWKKIMLFSAILTIFISCIGLFGLSVLSAEKRTKEIGIRKVLGASVNSVVTALSKDFIKLVALALLIAIPASWFAAHKWLENYPYRISLGWPMFAIAALMVMLIALVTVSFQAIKAAVANPVKSLRTE